MFASKEIAAAAKRAEATLIKADQTLENFNGLVTDLRLTLAAIRSGLAAHLRDAQLPTRDDV